MRFSRIILFLLSLAGTAGMAAELRPSDAAISTSDQPVLTLVAANGTTRELSLQDIEQVGLYESEFEHFEGIEGRFIGVLLEDLLSELEVADAGQIRLLALDGYSTFLNEQERESWDYLLATRLDGEPIPVAQMGPLMLVIPERAEAVLAGTAPMTQWIWSVTTLQAMP